MMIIDGNPTEIRAMDAYLRGDGQEGERVQDEFIAEFREAIQTQDHCSCKIKGCIFHGQCLECVAIHRGHRNHLPDCFHDIVGERLTALMGLLKHG